MKTSNIISVANMAPSYVVDNTLIPTIGDRTYIGDFPSQHNQTGKQIVHTSPVWIEPYVYPSVPRRDPIDLERFRKSLEQHFAPPTKFRVTESGERILLSLDIPGVRHGGVELTIEGYTVTVKAHRADLKQKIVETHTLTQEYDVDPREIDAWHEDGVLTVAFKRMGNGPVKIDVR